MSPETLLLTLLGAVSCQPSPVATAQPSVKARAFCLEGFTLDAANSLCVKNLKQPFTLTCPQHCEFDANGTCACVEEVSSEITCPPGFTLDASQKNCTTVVETPATPTCEQSSQKLLNNRCTGVIVLSPEFTCPAPAYMKGDLCVHEEAATPFEECPPGFELSAAPAHGVTATPGRNTRGLQMQKGAAAESVVPVATVRDNTHTVLPASAVAQVNQQEESTAAAEESTEEGVELRVGGASAPLATRATESRPMKRTLAPPFATGSSSLSHKLGTRVKGDTEMWPAPVVAATTGVGAATRLLDTAQKAVPSIGGKRVLQARGAAAAGGRLFSTGRGSRKAPEDNESPFFFERHANDRKKGLGIHAVALGERGGGVLRGAGQLNFGTNLTAASTAGGFDGYAAAGAINGEQLQQQQQQQHHGLGGTTARVCVSKTAVPARPSCPPNHRLEKDACVSEIIEAVNMACEEGFHYDGATQNCLRETMQPPVPECPEGYRVEGRLCVFTQIEEPQRTCRDGFVFSLEENMCIKILKEPPRFKCASMDYYFDGRSCEKTLNVTPTLTCPSGRLLSDACLVIDTLPGSPSCNPGAALDQTQMKCLSSSVAPVKYSCTQGELSENRTCLNHTTARARAVCPENFEMKGDTCVKEKTFQPVQSCPPNSQLLGSDCLLHTEEVPVYTCAAGFELHRDTCVMAKRVAPTQKCAAGYTPYKEKCIRQTRRSGQITCPESFAYDGTQCVINDQQRPIYVCPEGYSLEEYHGDSCVPDAVAAASAAAAAATAAAAAAAAPPASFPSPDASGAGLYTDDRRKVGLQVMALGRRKPQLLAASF